ncbi:MAG: internal scaffolding protein [Microvirus sp.]|nr:MAG: internal scaffolding protein [Microvirus sp.]
MKTTASPCPPTTTTPSTPNLRVRRLPQPIGSEPSATKQEFKDDCDINSILKKFQRTGAISHYSKYQAHYGDFSPCDYQTAQNLILNANQMYADLPSKIRDEFTSPDLFLAFVQDPNNIERMRELGLAEAATITRPPESSPPETTPSKGV